MAKKKENTKQAIRPSFVANLESLRRTEEADKAGITEEEQALYTMSNSAGWKHFENTAQALLEELDTAIVVSIQGGATKEEIGENTIIATMVKQVIKRLLSRVQDAKDAAEHRTD